MVEDQRVEGASQGDRAGGPADPSPAVSAKGAHPSRNVVADLQNRTSVYWLVPERRRLHADAVALIEGLQAKTRSLTRQLDAMYGTPCAQIRWQQERESLSGRIVELEALLSAAGRALGGVVETPTREGHSE